MNLGGITDKYGGLNGPNKYGGLGNKFGGVHYGDSEYGRPGYGNSGSYGDGYEFSNQEAGIGENGPHPPPSHFATQQVDLKFFNDLVNEKNSFESTFFCSNSNIIICF